MERILIVGSGGREHAIGWALKKESETELFFAPGNGGTLQLGANIDIAVDDIEALANWAKQNGVDIVIIGPELPLTLGLTDRLEQEGIKVFGPNKFAAQLEGSKAFSKAFMEKHNLPTARYNTYSDYSEALQGLNNYDYPVVIKADGLAAGKGVLICRNFDEAKLGLQEILQDQKFGQAGSQVIIEEFLQGVEASILCFCDGDTMVPMVSAQDYKRAKDNDQGLNTGGMGAVSPALHYSEKYKTQFEQEIIPATVKAMKQAKIEYKGVLFFGLMLTEKGVQILEFNARFGDPETEVVLMRLKTPLLKIVKAVCNKTLKDIKIEWDKNPAVCVVTAAGGYPESYNTGDEITIAVSQSENAQVFHAGTKQINGKTLTNGGRVLVSSAVGENLDEARKLAYQTAEGISFQGAFFRTDIAKQ